MPFSHSASRYLPHPLLSSHLISVPLFLLVCFTSVCCAPHCSASISSFFPTSGLVVWTEVSLCVRRPPLCCRVVSDTLSPELSFSVSTCCDLRVLKARHSCGRDSCGVKRGRLLRVREWAEEHTLRDVYTSTCVGGCALVGWCVSGISGDAAGWTLQVHCMLLAFLTWTTTMLCINAVFKCTLVGRSLLHHAFQSKIWPGSSLNKIKELYCEQ